ncbi:hypothetical protein HY091_02150 [Candidatus Kaiserbacteria bacterium]|nr:hypothetical protein [Candidatus Kaiserbacteria bacterium]
MGFPIAALIFFVGIMAGIIGSHIWRGTFGDKGHAFFAVASPAVQKVLLEVVKEYTGLGTFMTIDAGPTHQVVLSDMTTVFGTFDPAFLAQHPDLPLNVRALVVQDPIVRETAAVNLAGKLFKLGFSARIVEPLPEFPKGTFLLVQSNAFLGRGGIAFRPRGPTMAELTPKKSEDKGPTITRRNFLKGEF